MAHPTSKAFAQFSDKERQSFFRKLHGLIAHFDNDDPDQARLAFEKAAKLMKSAGLTWRGYLDLEKPGDKEWSILDMLHALFEKEAEALVRLGRANADYFCNSKGEAFADIMVDGRRETRPLASIEFTDWLTHLFYTEKRKAPTSAAMKNALGTLRAHARFEGEQYEVYLRVAEHDDKIYLDLGDREWRAVEIDINGWRVIHDPPVRFRRPTGMAALPVPQPGGSIAQLRSLVNLSEPIFVLYVATILDALRPDLVPRPVLYLAGEAGSGKSWLTEVWRSLTDPCAVPLRKLPGTVRDLFVATQSSYGHAFDNVSAIPHTLSDALCQLSSGSGFATRRLFTDLGEIQIEGGRPIALNGIANAITEPDLAQREILLPLSSIPSNERRPTKQLRKDFQRQRPLILGALLDAVVCGLRNSPGLHLEHLPRLADFVTWAVACEEGFAKPGEFLAAFSTTASEATEAVIENKPVAVAILAFMAERQSWTGTAASLLTTLNTRDESEARPSKWKGWPSDPTRFSMSLRSLTDILRKSGVEVVFDKAADRKKTRLVVLRRIGPPQPTRRAAASDAADATNTGRETASLVKFRKSQKP